MICVLRISSEFIKYSNVVVSCSNPKSSITLIILAFQTLIHRLGPHTLWDYNVHHISTFWHTLIIIHLCKSYFHKSFYAKHITQISYHLWSNHNDSIILSYFIWFQSKHTWSISISSLDSCFNYETIHTNCGHVIMFVLYWWIYNTFICIENQPT